MIPQEYGHAQYTRVFFDDIDGMGNVNAARFPALLDRALETYWWGLGHEYLTGDAFFLVRDFAFTFHVPIRDVGRISVHFWADRVGSTSVVIGFRFLSADGLVTHATGHRTLVKVDPEHFRPTPWSDRGRSDLTALKRKLNGC
jgi:acyl-CoA thioester hydrolase